MSFTLLAQGVLINVFLLLGFVALFSMLRDWPATRLKSIPVWANGLLFGIMAMVAMMVPSTATPGVIFDCRTGVIGAAALLGGPLCALASVPLPVLFRLHIGGAGVVPGLMEILLPALLGSACHLWCRRRSPIPALRGIVIQSLMVGACANGLIVISILAFLPRQELIPGVGGSLLVALLNGPVSMALFSALLVLTRQRLETAELHSHILQTAMEGFLLLDRRGRLLEVNEVYCRMSGYCEAELLNKRISDLETSMDEQQIAGRLREIEAAGSGRFESSHRRKDGSVFDVEVSARYFPREDGRFVSFMRDITERKKAEKALKESERKYKLLIETTHTGFVILDAAGRVLDANQEYVRMTGRGGLEEIRGRSVTDWTAPADLERNAAEVRKCLETGSVRNLEIDYLDAKGRIVPIEVHAAVISGGESPLIMTVCRDISERRLAAEEKKGLYSQLIQAQKMESVGRLAGGVAHDFNNMLGAIIGLADMAERGLPPGSALHDVFGQIIDAAQRSANLTHQLLAFASRQMAAPKAIDLNEAVESMLKMLRRLIGEDIQLVWKPAPGLEPVFIDPVQVDQILANLCINSRDAIGPGVGTVTIETGMVTLDAAYCGSHVGAAPGRHVVLAVRDDGCGMDGRTLEKIFEPFFTTKGVGKGTGLGLATVYGIVKQNKGAVEVQSEPGKGAIFRIYLPRHEAGITAKPEPIRAEEAPRGDETVLLVEDEAVLGETTRKMLVSLGYTVLFAAAPGEALRLAREYPGPVQLLVTDVIMPEMNGRDLAGRVLALRPGLKCLFMSGHTADIIAHHGVLDEGVNYLQKPFLVHEFAVKVRGVLES